MNLTDLLNPLYQAMPTFNREMTGFLAAVPVDASVSMAAKDEVVKVASAEVEDPQDATASMTLPDGGETTPSTVDVKMEKDQIIRIPLDGEVEKALANQGRLPIVVQQRFESAFRKFANGMEKYLADKVVAGACQAYGTAGTIPFGTAADLSDLAQLGKILNDNGAAQAGRNLVLNTAALANMQGKMSNLFKVNEFGSEEFLRTGYTGGELQGFKIWSSAGLQQHAKGAGTGYQASAAAAVGATDISVDTGTGAVLAGDIITFAGDNTKYVVNNGITAAGTLSIGKNGLKSALADNAAMTIGASYTPSAAFVRNAIAFGTRTPYMPEGGDGAKDYTTITDPVTGVTFGVGLYGGFRKNELVISVVYGARVVDPSNVALLIQ